MAIKHIGYAVIDNEGDPVLTDDDNLAFCEEKKSMDNYAMHMNECHFHYSPHKLVRVLIDDEAENG